MANYNDILGVDSTDSKEFINKKYKGISLKVHPDKGGSSFLMSLVNEAIEKIRNGKGTESYTRNNLQRNKHLEDEINNLKTKLEQVRRNKVDDAKKFESTPII